MMTSIVSFARRARSCPIAAGGAVGAAGVTAKTPSFSKVTPTQTAQTTERARLQNRPVPPGGGRKVRLLPFSAIPRELFRRAPPSRLSTRFRVPNPNGSATVGMRGLKRSGHPERRSQPTRLHRAGPTK